MTTVLIPASRNWQRPKYRWRAITTATGLPAGGLAIGDFTIERSINGSAYAAAAVDAATFAEIDPGLYEVEGTEPLPNDFTEGLVRGTRLDTSIVPGQLALDNTVYRGTVSVNNTQLTFPAGYVPKVGDVVWVFDGNAAIVNQRESIVSVSGQIATIRQAIAGLANTDEVVVLLGDTAAGLADTAVNVNIDAPISGIDDAVETILSDDFGLVASAAALSSIAGNQSTALTRLTELLNRLNSTSIVYAQDGLSATLSYPNPSGGAAIVLNLTIDGEGRVTNIAAG